MAPDRLTSSRADRSTRIVAAGFIVAAGVVHLQQYFGVYYRDIPVIGPLFLADFVLALLVGAALSVPLGRIWRPLSTLAVIGGLLFAAGAIAGLEISESGTLFGFHEHGYRLAVVLSVAFEGAACILLLANLGLRGRSERWPTASDRGPGLLHRALSRPRLGPTARGSTAATPTERR